MTNSREVIGLHSLSPSIVLKRAPKFENHFLRILLEKLGTKLYSSNSYHPQKNGQNEIENIALSTMPRVIIKGKHNSRDENAYNKVVHKTTYISTFEVVCGLSPLSLFELLPFPKGFVPKEKVKKIENFKMHKKIREHILLEYMVLNERGVNCLREIFANFEGIMKINAELQRKESRKQIPKTVLR